MNIPFFPSIKQHTHLSQCTIRLIESKWFALIFKSRYYFFSIIFINSSFHLARFVIAVSVGYMIWIPSTIYTTILSLEYAQRYYFCITTSFQKKISKSKNEWNQKSSFDFFLPPCAVCRVYIILSHKRITCNNSDHFFNFVFFILFLIHFSCDGDQCARAFIHRSLFIPNADIFITWPCFALTPSARISFLLFFFIAAFACDGVHIKWSVVAPLSVSNRIICEMNMIYNFNRF